MTRLAATGLALVTLVAMAACRDPGRDAAEQAVRSYLDKLIEAYRASDETIVDPLVGDELGYRLTGLIGVKTDGGIRMEAKLLELEFEGVREEGAHVVVDSRERWYYRDVRLDGKGQVGEDSIDVYVNRYRLRRVDGGFKILAVEFREPPTVGRTATPLVLDTRKAHGLPAKPDAAAQPGGRAGAAAPAGGK